MIFILLFCQVSWILFRPQYNNDYIVIQQSLQQFLQWPHCDERGNASNFCDNQVSNLIHITNCDTLHWFNLEGDEQCIICIQFPFLIIIGRMRYVLLVNRIFCFSAETRRLTQTPVNLYVCTFLQYLTSGHFLWYQFSTNTQCVDDLE